MCAGIDLESSRIINDSKNNEKVDPSGSKEQIFTSWATALNKTLRYFDPSEIKGVGFAMPGPFDYKTGIALFKGSNEKFERLYDLNLRNELPPYLECSGLELRFLNDATSFGVGVSWFGEAKGHDRSLVITLGTGFGSTFIESGLPITDREDVPNNGFFWDIPFHDGIADEYFSTRWFIKEYESRFGNRLSGVKEIAEKARKDDTVVAVFESFGGNLGEFLTPWLRKFPAEILVIGGNISGAIDLFGASLKKHLTDENINIEVKASVQMEDAALIGSARLFEDWFWEKIKDRL